MCKKTKVDMYLEDREKGMTLRQIAEKHGVSYQAVATSIAQQDPSYRKKITKKGCIYPNLLKWLNEDKQKQDAFFAALKGHGARNYLNGTQQPKKDVIDIMLRVTGMSYEVMFAQEGRA